LGNAHGNSKSPKRFRLTSTNFDWVCELSPSTNLLRYSSGAESKFISIRKFKFAFANTFYKVSKLAKLRSKFLAEKAAERKLQESRSSFVATKPSHVPAHFDKWIEGRNRTNHKAHLFEEPYRPPAYLTCKPVDPERKRTRRSPPKSSSIFPIPSHIVALSKPAEESKILYTKPKTSKDFWKPIKFLGPPENPSFEDPDPILNSPPIAADKLIKKSQKARKPRTKWHCNICSLRHLSSEKQLLDHQGSFRCQARQNRDNPFRCRKCGKKCGNVVNYHRHKEARCYRPSN